MPTDPFSDEKFKALRDRWEKRLEKEGLGETLPSGNPYRSGTVSHDSTSWIAKRNYFAELGKKVQEEKIPVRAEKVIMTMRSEGRTIVSIFKELKRRKTPRAKKTIRHIIRRWENKWGLRKWTLKQMWQRK